MKKFIFFSIVVFSILNIFGQQITQHPCSEYKIKSFNKKANNLVAKTSTYNPPENKYDLKFYHLNLNVERNSLFISGNVKSIANVVVSSLDSFAFVLHENHTIDSIYINGSKCNFVRQDSLVKAGVGIPISQNQLFESIVYYQGTCPSTPGIDNGYNNNVGTPPGWGWGNEVAWTHSESFIAYQWFPCKQDLRDKIDSSWVFATTDSVNMVGSNGLLKNVVIVGNKKRYEWKSKHPIDYYLISVATAKYKQYNLYAKPQYLAPDSILIQNFIYENTINNPAWNNEKLELNKIVPTMELLCNLYGMYPFHDEKYGHCMTPMGGAMEHQTMTSTRLFDFGIDAHELGHQWWGDNVTCKGWKDIFINEGWASYTGHLCEEYLTSSAAALLSMTSVHNNIMSQPGGSSYFTNADTMNIFVIFDSRLTYNKGSAIIHMLRYTINNDSTFFNAIRGFQHTYKGSTASVIDFKTYMETFSGINLTQFFNQWYYGEGFPTFNVKWNQVSGTFLLQSTQTQSMPSSVPLFITDIDYRISRTAKADTIVRLNHAQATENYTLALTGTVTSVFLDPNNWILNKVVGPTKDPNLGVNGLNEMSLESSVFIGPNPTSDVLNVYLYTQQKATVEVLDISGKLVLSQNISNHAEFDVSKFANGIYTVNIKNDQNELLKSTKVVKN